MAACALGSDSAGTAPATDQGPSSVLTHDAAIVRHGTLTVGALRVTYFTSNPAPTQWVAVGIVSGTLMLTGIGASETAAISAMCARYQRLQNLSA